MRIQRRGIVLLIRHLVAHAGGEEGVAAGSIENVARGKKPRRPGLLAAGCDVLAAVRPPKATEAAPAVGPEAHEEVGQDPAEAQEEFVEATPEQLAASGAEAGEESAVSDLKAEGYEGRVAVGAEPPLREAGAAVQGGQPEFFGLLAALVPTLISSVGPALAGAVSKKLSPGTRQAITAIAKRAPAVAPKITGPNGLSGLIPLVAKLFETAAESGGDGVRGEAGEEGAPVSEALVAETAAAMETIIGNDDRYRISNTTNEPWRGYCALRIYFPSGAQYRGTGFFIGPTAVATAESAAGERRRNCDE